MTIKKVQLENFRNFKALDLPLSQGFVVLSGENGAGKTNFLESVYFAASLRRFPESSLSQLFAEGMDYFHCQLFCEDETGDTENLDVLYEKGDAGFRSTLKVNGQKGPRQKYTGVLSAVSFLPQDLNLLTRSPAGRRRYLDETLCLVSSEYRHNLSRYEQVLRQRNELLAKIGSGQAAPESAVWDEKLAEYGSALTAVRQRFFEFLNVRLPPILRNVSVELEGVNFLYHNSGLSDREQFLAALAGLKKRETAVGSTAMGPHRDDFETQIGGRRAVGYLSRGQLRSITLALKILEKKYIEDETGRPPIFLLDDVFSEFDGAHQQKLIGFLAGLKQVFLTTAHPEEIKVFLPAAARVFSVKSGTITPL